MLLSDEIDVILKNRDLLDCTVQPECPMFFAFDQEQLRTELDKYLKKYPNLTEKDIYSFGNGMFGSRDNYQIFCKNSERIDKKRIKLLENDGCLYYAFKTQFWNFEFCYAWDQEETLNKITKRLLRKNLDQLTERELKILNEAKHDYNHDVYDYS